MTSSTDFLLGEAASFASSWVGALCRPGNAVTDAELPDAGLRDAGLPDVSADVKQMTDSGLLRALDAGFRVKRHVDALLARLAGEVQSRSRASLGAEGLARTQGNANAAALLTERGLISFAEASRLCRAGAATAPRVGIRGERSPASFPVVGAALDAGSLPVESAQWIMSNLAEAAPRADQADLAAAEEHLVAFACEHPADTVRQFAIRWRDRLDTDGTEPREEALTDLRGIRRVNRMNGMKRYILDLDPLGAAYIDAALDAEVGAELRRVRFEALPVEGLTSQQTNGQTDGATDGHTGDGGADDGRAHDGTAVSPDGCHDEQEIRLDGRTIAQIGADTIVDLARHGLSCNDTSAPLAAAAIVVRIPLDALRTGLGEAQIDGIEQPISAKTARRLAADAGIIPIVLGGKSEVLDLGVSRRLFSRAQRIAFAERDDGCAWANCPRPPSHAEAHHIDWWKRDDGETNLDNGILLCTRHHHDVHRSGWEIRVVDGVPWFIPPSTVDVYRKPRRGGRMPSTRLCSEAA